MNRLMRYQVIVTYKNGKKMVRINHNKGYGIEDPKLLRLIDRLNEDEDVENIEVVEFDPEEGK